MDQQTPPTAAQATFDKPAQDILALLQGKADAAALFTPAFNTAVPAGQLAKVIAGLKAQFGEPQSVIAVRAMDARSASIDIAFDMAVVTFTIGVQDDRLSGLFVTGTRAVGDSIAQVAADLAALPGRTGYVLQQITPDGVKMLSENKSEERFAIASAFKLYVLAEIDRAVRAGERSWDDVLPLTQKSHPSGIAQDWPDNAPMTLQTLATLMISVSDNSATDTLIAALGQKKLAAIIRASGHKTPEDLTPLLTTQAVTGLKMPANAACAIGFSPPASTSRSGYWRTRARRCRYLRSTCPYTPAGRTRSTPSNGSPAPPTLPGCWQGWSERRTR